MFSGGDSSEGMNSLNKFSSYGFVNQAAVSNAVAAGQNIDWAQLAQQWIQMRDNKESGAIEAPPPPDISYVKNTNIVSKSSKFVEQGEADMDMDDEEQTDKCFLKIDNKNHAACVIQQRNTNQPWLINQAAILDNTGSQLVPRSSDSTNQWNVWPNRDCLTQSNQPNSSNRPTNPTAHIPSLLKITVPHPNEIRAMSDLPNSQDNSSTMMDAAKRKGLPAWIRDGLEKMEREKQKQMEVQQHKDNAWYSSDDDTDPVKSPNSIMVKSLSTNNDVCADDHGDSTDNENITIAGENNSSEKLSIKITDDNIEYDDEATCKTYEQKLADLMIVVRRTLTELLLEVTNEEISKVADETVKSYKTKGLAVYGNSSSDENSEDDEHDSSKQNYQSESDIDSEEDIKNTIRSKRRAFGKISDEIEECVATAASREEEKLKYFLRVEEEEREKKRKKYDRLQSSDPTCSGYSGLSIGKGYERDFGETSETKLQHLNGKRQKDRGARKERTTRFSDNKDNKYVALAATATFISNMNATASAANTGSSNVTHTQASNTQRHNIPDVNGLLTNCPNAGMTSVLNAADAALEKALKRKTSQSPKKNDRRHNNDRDRTPSKKRLRRGYSKDSRSRSLTGSSTTSSSSSSSSSSDSESSTSRSSHNSKYRSTTKHKSHKSEKLEQSPRGRRDRRSDDHKYSSSSSSYKKRDRESSSSRYHHRHLSSDSDDDYSRRKYDSHYSRNSSHSRTHTLSSSRRDRDRSRSRSRSSYSSSSNRRH